MFKTKPPKRTPESVVSGLRKRHKKLMKPGEVFLAACDGFAVEAAYPVPLRFSRRQSTETRTPAEQLALEGAGHLRAAAVSKALEMGDREFQDLPVSSNGFLLAHTDRRLFLFDGLGRKYLMQAPMKGLWLQPVEHEDTCTLVLISGHDRVAITTRRESANLTADFIESFPDRRGQARRVTATSASSIAF